MGTPGARGPLRRLPKDPRDWPLLAREMRSRRITVLILAGVPSKEAERRAEEEARAEWERRAA